MVPPNVQVSAKFPRVKLVRSMWVFISLAGLGFNIMFCIFFI